MSADFVGVRFALGLAVALVQLDSLAAVGIVESSGELDVNLRFAIDFPVAQQPVDQDPQAEQCPHRHRIAYCRRSGRAQLQDALRIGQRRLIDFDHRRMIEAPEAFFVDAPAVAQIVADALLLGRSPVQRIPSEIGYQRGDVGFDSASFRFVGVDVRRQHRLEVGDENRLVIAITFTQVGQNLVNGMEAQRGVVLRQADGGETPGLVVGEAQFLLCPRAKPFFVVEREERVPYVAEYLFSGLSGPERIQVAYFRQIVVAEQRNEGSCDRASRDGGCPREVEAIGRLATVSLAGVSAFAGELLGDLLEIEVRFGSAPEKRQDRFGFLSRERTRFRVVGRRDPDVVDEGEHPELLESRMRYRAAAFALLERASADRSLLRFQRPLVENGAVQCLPQIVGEPLFFADGPKFGQIVLVARGVFRTDFLFSGVKPIKVFAQVGASGLLHVDRQVLDVLSDLTALAFVAGILAIAQESAPLRQMI